LRSISTGSAVARRAGFIKSDGSIVDIDGSSLLAFPTASPGSYYILLYHRNHLTIMSASAQPLDASSALYNFSTSQNQAFTQGSDPMVRLMTGVFGLYAGDANGDGAVDSFDYNSVWAPDNGQIGYYTADMNMDGSVDSFDVNAMWAPNNGAISQIP
jgi:hypothetical protein